MRETKNDELWRMFITAMKSVFACLLFSLFSFTYVIAQKGDAVKLEIKDDAIVKFYDHSLKLQQVKDSLKSKAAGSTQKTSWQKQLTDLNSTQKSIQDNFTLAKENAKAKVNSLIGEISFTFNGWEYHAIIINPTSQKIKMHWLSSNNTIYKNLGSVKKDLSKTSQKVLMLTNGGMYQEDNTPLGLFISEGKELKSINTKSSSFGNFYIQPNGVFYTDSAGAYLITTAAFTKMNKAKKQTIQYATQSGPMLVLDDKINSQFTHQSRNFNLRSGVGKLSNNNIVFIISRSYTTNFHDFAVIFRDVFGCKNALYLDGAISRMYLPALRPTDLGGDFGVIISATDK